MSYLERLRWGTVEPRLQRIFEHFHAERGNVPNLFRVMGRRPELLTSFNAHFGAVLSADGTLDVGFKEMLAVRVSQINDCGYWLASHTVLARRHGVSEEVLEALHDPATAPVSDAERAALRFAERMTREAAAMDQADVDALRAHYSDDQIVEMACVVGMFNYLNRFAEAMGLWPTKPGEGGPDDPETDS